jgi:hypothetical protein
MSDEQGGVEELKRLLRRLEMLTAASGDGSGVLDDRNDALDCRASPANEQTVISSETPTPALLISELVPVGETCGGPQRHLDVAGAVNVAASRDGAWELPSKGLHRFTIAGSDVAIEIELDGIEALVLVRRPAQVISLRRYALNGGKPAGRRQRTSRGQALT